MADDSSVGTRAWSNPDNAKVSDDVYTLCSGNNANNTISHYLKATNFGFSIPTGATVDGITVEIEKKSLFYTSGQDYNRDYDIELVKGGVISSNNKADTATDWPATDTYTSYGSSSDLWGLSLTPADINASDFGVVIAMKWFRVDAVAKPNVDHICITVYYTESGATGLQVQYQGGAPSGVVVTQI